MTSFIWALTECILLTIDNWKINNFHYVLIAPLFLRTITFILIIISSFILIMFGERIEAYGFINTKTVWFASQSSRMTATCMFSRQLCTGSWWGPRGQEGLLVLLQCMELAHNLHKLPPVSNDVNNRRSLLVCCLPVHNLVEYSQDVIWQISICRWKSHAFACSNTVEQADKFTYTPITVYD